MIKALLSNATKLRTAARRPPSLVEAVAGLAFVGLGIQILGRYLAAQQAELTQATVTVWSLRTAIKHAYAETDELIDEAEEAGVDTGTILYPAPEDLDPLAAGDAE